MFGPRDQTEEIINLIWNRNLYYLVTAGKSAPSKKQLRELASHYGVTLPNDYLAHATGYWGGLYLEVREQFWPRHKAGDVGPFWSFLYGVFVHAYSEEAPEWMQLRTAAGEFQALGHKVLPFLKVIGDADVCRRPHSKMVSRRRYFRAIRRHFLRCASIRIFRARVATKTENRRTRQCNQPTKAGWLSFDVRRFRVFFRQQSKK